jgi:hypothetical protein
MRIEMEYDGSSQYHARGTDTPDENEELQKKDQGKRGRMTSNQRCLLYFLTTTLLFLAGVSLVATTTTVSVLQVGTTTGHSQAQSEPPQRRLAEVPVKEKILYIITTLAEYNSGTRATVRGSDRLQETLIPVVSEGVRTMLAAGYEVDGTCFQYFMFVSLYVYVHVYAYKKE